MGCFDNLYVPKHLISEPFWGQKKGAKWAENVFFRLCPGPNGVLKRMFLAHVVAIWDCLNALLVCPKNVWKGPKSIEMCHKNRGCGRRISK